MTGRVLDSYIDGLRYYASPSGRLGITFGGGQYDYQAGDIVYFRLGANWGVVGGIPATGIVTPVELAKGDPNTLVNLLVLFQSLDTDGNPANGITMSVPGTFTPTIDLRQDPAIFASPANTGLVDIMQASGITTPIVTVASATEHFRGQFTTLASSNIWAFTSLNKAAMIRVKPTGEYQLGLVDNTRTDNNREDAELGRIATVAFDARGFSFTTTMTLDKNPIFGFGGATGPTCERVRFPGAVELRECDDALQARLLPMDHDPTGIVGAWFTNSNQGSVPAVPQNSSAVLFFANGTYLLVDTEGQREAGCGSTVRFPHTEYGTYSYDAATSRLNVTRKFSTNECHRFSLSGAEGAAGVTFTVGINGDLNHAKFFTKPLATNYLGMFRLSK